MIVNRWSGLGLLLSAMFALWLLLASPDSLLGLDTGHVGMVLLITTAWVSLFAVSRLPRDAVAEAASPGEWNAWIGTVFMAAAVAYLVSNVDAFRAATVWNDPVTGRVVRNLVALLIAWSVLRGVLARRWSEAVTEDERDREIAAKAAGWGRFGLVAFCVGVAGILGLSPQDRLQWASHLVIANLLILGLMLSCLLEYLGTAIYYWRDRH
ncbi:hypothetical protein INQ41_09540 [Lysobacter ciconiae]|uniref:Uncharacterized protein n=1 Tax=Novilysobacter ciconiae TaxID=2781022 RepID=A0A7S6UER6_9GAMM|nr:hypothetical protein [Lysobacter ciconiae]QOW18915.1 hypothetical protein INQ41_09540 [Lysobacter ciconiae]